MNKETPSVICQDIFKTYVTGVHRVDALKGVTLTINRGELRLLMGPSGSGKTTLISIIAAILSQDSGTCLINNIDVHGLKDEDKTHYRGKHIGFVFQIFNLIPFLSNEDNISIPLLIQGTPEKEVRGRAKELMHDLGLGDKIGFYPTELSGGQQQRVAIARALIHEPEIIVYDEPTSFLDHISGNKIMELLRDLVKKKNLTLIVVTHDPRIVELADKIDFLEDGMISSHK